METIILKKIKIGFINERIIPASGHAVVGTIPGKNDSVKQGNYEYYTKLIKPHQQLILE